jgi:hypothetical protein
MWPILRYFLRLLDSKFSRRQRFKSSLIIFVLNIYSNMTVTVLKTPSSEVFMAVSFHVEVFWVMTPYSVIVGHQRFGGPCCLHLQ